MHQNSIILLIKPVLDQSGIHTTRLNRNDELCIVILEFNIVHTERDLVAAFADVLLTMDGAIASFRLFGYANRSEHRCPVLLRTDMKVLTLQGSYDLKILNQPIAL